MLVILVHKPNESFNVYSHYNACKANAQILQNKQIQICDAKTGVPESVDIL